MPKKGTWCSYEEASKRAQVKGIKTLRQWWTWCKCENFPDDIPTNPQQVYKDQWKGFGSFLGTGTVATQNRIFCTYAEASAWAQMKKIKTSTEWKQWCKRDDFPDNIPVNPSKVYKHQWKGMGVFLGTGYVHKHRFCTYAEASAWAKSKQIKTVKEWKAWSKREDFPHNIPANPHTVYKDQWKGFPEFLGAPCSSGVSKVEQILKHGLSTVLDLDESCRVSIRDGIRRPMHVDMVDRARKLILEYDGSWWHAGNETKDREKSRRLVQAGWSVIRVREAPLQLLDPVMDVSVAPPTGTYISLIVSVLIHLQSLIERGVLQDDVLRTTIRCTLEAPIDESAFYGILYQGWQTYTDASAWAQSRKIKTVKEWKAWCKREDFPDNIPTNPQIAYRDQWKGWGAFLGTGKVRTKPFCTYDEASAWAQSKKIQTVKEWQASCKCEDFPDNIPTNPYKVYKNHWKGWGTFLGTGRKQNGWKPTPTYIIRLAKPGDAEAQNDGVFDPVFVMPRAA